jgi:hypothetical protein
MEYAQAAINLIANTLYISKNMDEIHPLRG